MANQSAQFIGRYLDGPKMGQPATQQVTIIDTNANLAQFIQRNNRTGITFSGNVRWDDFTMVANTATITRVAPVIDGDIQNTYSMLTVYASSNASGVNDRMPAGSWVQPTGTELALESFTV